MSTKAVSVASWMSLSDAGELRPGTRAIDLLRTVASICRVHRTKSRFTFAQ